VGIRRSYSRARWREEKDSEHDQNQGSPNNLENRANGSSLGGFTERETSID
jgi:hypothetical protein